MQIVEAIATGLGLTFTAEKQSTTPSLRATSTTPPAAPLHFEGESKTSELKTFAPIDLLDYIYAVLHSPSYRKTYKEFLKIDFPRVPYPTDVKQFWQLVALGSELRQLHLLEGAAINQLITSYPENGNNLVNKPRYDDGKVYINDAQYFAGVPKHHLVHHVREENLGDRILLPKVHAPLSLVGDVKKHQAGHV